MPKLCDEKLQLHELPGSAKGRPFPINCPTFSESAADTGVWEEWTRAQEDATLPRPTPTNDSLRVAPAGPLEVSPAPYLPPLPKLLPLSPMHSSRMPGGWDRGMSGCGNSWFRPQQKPRETVPGRKGHGGLISSQEAEALTQSPGVWAHRVRAWWPAPSGSIPQGLTCSGRVDEESARGWGRLSQFADHGQFPQLTARPQQEPGWGSS